MKDIYVVVPKGTKIHAAADDFDRASESMAGATEDLEVVNVNLLEEDD